MSEQELHSIIKHKLDQIAPPFNNRHWEEMQYKLQESGQLTEKYSPSESKVFLFTQTVWQKITLAAACLVAMMLSWVYLMPSEKNDLANQAEIPQIAALSSTQLEENDRPVAQQNPKHVKVNRKTQAASPILLVDSILAQVPIVTVDDYDPFQLPRHMVVLSGFSPTEQNPQLPTGLDSLSGISKIELVYTLLPNSDTSHLSGQYQQQLKNLVEKYPFLLSDGSIPIRIIERKGVVEGDTAHKFNGWVFYKQNTMWAEKLLKKPLNKLPLKKLTEKPHKRVDPVTAKLEREIREQFNYWQDSMPGQVAGEQVEQERKSSVVVLDWSPSMHMHVAEATKWLHENMGNTKIQGYVFFNDCDEDGVPISSSGKPGAMYTATPGNFEEILDTMLKVARYGMANNDWYENDFNAIKYAMEAFPDVEEIILVADNKSNVRDVGLITDFNKPVRVVLCGTTFVKPYHPDYDFLPIKKDYLALVERTNGSMHVIENDDFNLAEPTDQQTVLNIDGKRYRYSKEFKRWERI